MLVPSSDVDWTDIWNVVGLRGTACDQFALTDHFVRGDHSITRDFAQQGTPRVRPALPHVGDDLLRARLLRRGAGHRPRRCLDNFVDVARNKIPRGKVSPIRDNAVVQTNLAQVEVGIRSARAFLLQSVAEIWKKVSAGDKLSVDHRITIRMASTNAIHRSREAVDFAYNAAGATAIFENHPLERRFRDIHTVTQQLQGRLSHFETVGAWMLGADADLTFV